MKKNHLFKIVALIVLCCAMLGCGKPDDPTNPTDNLGSIYGTVTDKSTGDCVPNAGVELMPKGLRTVTGTDGTFEFVDIDPGQYNLFITKVGYQDYKSNNITVRAGETARGDVQIEKMPASLRIVDNSGNELTEVDFGSNEGMTSKTFNIFNGGTETLSYTITKTANWIESISQASGTVNVGVTFPIILTINRELLTEGLNSTSLLITSPSAGGVELTVKATKGTTYTGNCTVIFELFDTYGDGWNGAKLGVSDGTSTYQLTIQSGNIANYSYDFPIGTNVSVTFSGGQYNTECSYRIYYDQGDVIYEKTAGTISSGLQCTFTVDCNNPHTGGGGGNINNGDELSVDFESGIPIGWETIDADGDGYTFVQQDPSGFPGHSGKCVSSASYIHNIGALNPDNYLVTPRVAITNGSVFSFWACAQDSGYPSEHFGVAISQSSQTNASSFTLIKEWTMQAKEENSGKERGSNEQGGWHKYSVNLSSYAGKEVYIAIRHFNCTDQFYLDIDDVTLQKGN